MKRSRLFPLVFLALGSLLFGGCKPSPRTGDAPPPTPETLDPSDVAPSSTIPAQPAGAPAKLRIVAWNLQWFPGQQPEPTPDAEARHMRAAQAALTELQPDILLLQEVRDWQAAAELCRVVPGLQVHVASRFEGRPQNQIVASRLPADSGWSDLWKTDVVTPPRGYSFAALELPGPRFILAYSLHLKSNLGELANNITLRQAAARELLAHVQEMLALYGRRGPAAVVIGGDFNTSLDEPKFAADQTLRALTAAGLHWTHQGVPRSARVTIPGKGEYPDDCFDHIFTAGLGQHTARVRPFPGLSDHHPVVLEVDLSQADFRPRLDVARGRAMLPAAEPPPTVAGVLAPTDFERLKAAAGKIVTVQGRVQNVGATDSGSIHFINFAGVPRGGFVGIVRQDRYALVADALGGDLKAALAGKTITLSGEIVLYRDAPQIVVTNAAQIRVQP